jgi:hypothetical protein
MKRIITLDKEFSHNAKFFLEYLKCLKLIVGIHKSSLRNGSLKFAIKILRTAYFMENSFLGNANVTIN